MVSHRWRPVFISGFAVIAIWVIALIGFNLARNLKMTADKVRAYMESVDLKKLSSADRVQALRKLADKLNSLSSEERRRAQLERVPFGWFDQMTEAEQSQFLEATMPAGLRQMLTAFEQLPEDKRRRAIEDTVRRLKESQNQIRSEEGLPPMTNGFPQINAELAAKLRVGGLATLYSQSPAQVKAELAPVLEELQRVMESGRVFRGR